MKCLGPRQGVVGMLAAAAPRPLFCQLLVLYQLLMGDGTTGVPRPETLRTPLGRVFEQCLHHSFKVAVFPKPGFS